MAASGRHWGEIELLSVTEVARILRVSPHTVYRGVKAGTITHIRVEPRGAIRIPGFALDELAGLAAPKLIADAERATASAADQQAARGADEWVDA